MSSLLSLSIIARWRHAALIVTALSSGAAVALAGCAPEIGDKCVLSTDCSTRGDRLCDTSQPGGYCTQFNCLANGCPEEAACVLFNAAIAGCGYNDRAGASGSRVARAFCVGMCTTNDDCRSGYICADPKTPPWSGLILDIDQNKRTCLVLPGGYTTDAGADAANFSAKPPAPVCSPVAPDVPAIDAGAPRRPVEAGVLPPLVSADSGIGDAGDAGDAADASDGG